MLKEKKIKKDKETQQKQLLLCFMHKKTKNVFALKTVNNSEQNDIHIPP